MTAASLENRSVGVVAAQTAPRDREPGTWSPVTGQLGSGENAPQAKGVGSSFPALSAVAPATWGV